MPIRRYKPTSAGRRFMSVSTFEEITKSEPEKSLLAPLTKKGGRNDNGRITTRHQGGGHKRRYRIIDFKRRKDGVPAKVAAIEYDPNRSARIALLHYADGAKSYILAPAQLQVGATVESGPRPTSRSATRCRSRTSRRERSSTPSSSSRARARRWRAPPARASSSSRRTATSRSCASRPARCAACRSRAARRSARSGTSTTRTSLAARPAAAAGAGKRPTVRGSAMNPVDHPHGGGEGKSKGGRHPVTPWGVPTLGKRTRSQAQGIRQVDRPRPSPRQGGSPLNVAVIEEGAFRGGAADEPHRGDERLGLQEHDQAPGRARRRSSRRWSATRSPSTTAASTCPCSSPSRWSATSSASSRRRGRSAATPAIARRR